MGRDLQPACAADAHPFDAIKKAAYQRTPIDPHLRDQRLSVVLERCGPDGSPRRRPADRFALVEPQSEAYPEIVLTAHRLTCPRHVLEQRETRPQARTKRPS